MKRAYFQYYETFENVVNKIKDIEEREHFRRVIINYGLYGEEPASLSELEDMAWAIVKDLIDQQTHRREVNAENRSKRQKEQPEEKPAETTPEQAQAESPAEGQTQEKPETEEKTERKRKNFVKPTVEEIAAYCKEKNYSVNAEQFYSYYESNGWKVGGRAAMKDWKAALQNWETRDKAAGKTAGTMWTQNSTDAETAGYEDLF